MYSNYIYFIYIVIVIIITFSCLYMLLSKLMDLYYKSSKKKIYRVKTILYLQVQPFVWGIK